MKGGFQFMHKKETNINGENRNAEHLKIFPKFVKYEFWQVSSIVLNAKQLEFSGKNYLTKPL